MISFTAIAVVLLAAGAGVFWMQRVGKLRGSVVGMSLALFLSAVLVQMVLALAVFGQSPQALLRTPFPVSPWLLAGFLCIAALTEEAARAVTNLRLLKFPDLKARLCLAAIWWIIATWMAVLNPAVPFLDNAGSLAAEQGLEAALARADREAVRVISGIGIILVNRLPYLGIYLASAWLIAPGPALPLRLAAAVVLHAAFNIVTLIVLQQP